MHYSLKKEAQSLVIYLLKQMFLLIRIKVSLELLKSHSELWSIKVIRAGFDCLLLVLRVAFFSAYLEPSGRGYLYCDFGRYGNLSNAALSELKISTRMAYLIAIGSTVCGTTAIIATAPVINAKKGEVAYAIANMTIFGILAMLIYPYFANFYFTGEPLLIGLFLGTSIHETSQVAAAGLIYEQQFNSPETLNIATVTKLIRNTFLIVMIPLFAFLYNRGQTKERGYSILNIFHILFWDLLG